MDFERNHENAADGLSTSETEVQLYFYKNLYKDTASIT